MLSLWVNNLGVMSEQYSVDECIIFGLWENNVQFMSEQCSVYEYNDQFMSEQCLVYDWTILSLWITMLRVLVNYA